MKNATLFLVTRTSSSDASMNTHSRRLLSRDAFSLTELMVVLVIVGVLVLLALPKLLPVVTKSH